MPGYMDQTAGGAGFIPGAATISQAPSWQDQENKIKRTLAMAEALRAQGIKQPEGQMVSGHYVAPSWAERLVPLFNQAQAGYMEREADKQQGALQFGQEQGAREWMGQMPQAQEVTTEQPFQAPGIDEADAAAASTGAKVLKKAMQEPTVQARLQWAQEGQRNPLTKALAAAYGADTLIKEPERQAGREERAAARADRLAQQEAERKSREEIAARSRELQAQIAAGNLSLREAQIQMQGFIAQTAAAQRAESAAGLAAQRAGMADDRRYRQEDRLRADYDEVTKDTRTGLDAIEKVGTVLSKAPGQKLSNPEQQALITLFNKFLDPGSVVREGEYNRMAQGMGLFQQAQNLYDKIASGSVITPQMAAEIGKVAQLYRQAAEGKMTSYGTQYSDLAKQRGLDVGAVITNPKWRGGGAAPVPEGAVKPRGAPAAAATTEGPPPGAVRPR